MRSRDIAHRGVSRERRMMSRATPRCAMRSRDVVGGPQVLTRSRSAMRTVTTTRRAVRTRMAIKEISMPALSSTMTEGKIVSWLMSEGDAIGKGDAVVVVESDKADMDVESFVDGIIAHIAVEDGEMATVGAPIAYVVDDESEIAEAKAKSGGAAAAPAAAPAPAAAEPA